MIAFDTNVLVRMLVEDNADQARSVRDIVTYCDNHSIRIMIPAEVLIETVWVLESGYGCTRQEIQHFLETMIKTPLFVFSDPFVINTAILQYKKSGDFADLVIVNQAKRLQAKKLISFDRKLQNRFPGFVVASIESQKNGGTSLNI